MSYKLVRQNVNKLQQLEDEVNMLVGLGWKTVGEVKQTICEGTPIFIQQMEFNINQPKRLINERPFEKHPD